MGVVDLERRAAPTIDGSEGGFIGLIVGLGVIIIICSIAVFFLLRSKTDRERRMGEGPTIAHGSEPLFPGPSKKGIMNIFGGGKRSKKQQGWTQQMDDAREFDSESEDGIQLVDSPPRQERRNKEKFSQPSRDKSEDMSGLPAIPQQERYPGTHHELSSVSSVTLTAPGHEDSGSSYVPGARTASPPTIDPPVRHATTDSNFSTKDTGTKFREDIYDET